ncbi:hypothetical protein LPTSP4_30780 [Leptospira ryugenii]|uniref:DUF1577 domain-containing protein n=1 Tax=Leptospira ryugenii TaxID=1917863 RepID=A0A2P2E3S0_9LEPT|nr:DUF1577 domain-containing protein [Leptospira ryugenii]GBF51540.1 hypothetical protein LPTSP4_30780 [Leptospira ryugenii]
MILPIKTHFQKERAFEDLDPSVNISEFFKSRMAAEGLFLKGYDTDLRIKFKGERQDGSHIFETDVVIDLGSSKFTVYTTPSYHIEVEYELLNQKDTLLLGKILSKKISNQIRVESRNDKVYGTVVASNFLIAKTNIDFSKLTGVSSQVILTDIHKNLLNAYPKSKVVFVAGGDQSDEIDLLREKQKPLYILNTHTLESHPSSEVFDPKSAFEEDMILEDKIAEYKRKKIDSFLLYPIFIAMNDLHFFAYLTIEMEKTSVPEEVFQKYKEVESTFQARIMDSNTQVLDLKQNVFNVSRGGLSIEIREREIIKALKVKPSMTLDINFKMQAPLRMAVELRHMEEVKDYFVVGGQIVGLIGDKKAKDIYYSLITFFS